MDFLDQFQSVEDVRKYFEEGDAASDPDTQALLNPELLNHSQLSDRQFIQKVQAELNGLKG